MPSSSKTEHLSLNHWAGTDKPKKDDFNSDNQKVDLACKYLAADVAGLGTSVSGLSGRVTGAESSAAAAAQAVNSHIANSGLHVTAEEKAAWNAMGGGSEMVIDTYRGTGTATLKVTLGFRPAAGFLFGIGVAAVHTDWPGEETQIYSGFFSRLGSGQSISLQSDGFTVTHSVTKPADGFSYKYNQTGVTYVYVVWR